MKSPTKCLFWVEPAVYLHFILVSVSHKKSGLKVMVYVHNEVGLVIRVSGNSSRVPGFDSRRY
jgi:hypothetical protein